MNSVDSDRLPEPPIAEFPKGSLIMRLAAIGVVIATIVGLFAYAAGWLTPHDLTPARLTDGFEQVAGIHPGFRRNHAKGVCVTGFFESNGNATRLSKAAVFAVGRVPVVGRFSLAGGDPHVADAPEMIRGLGLLLTLPDGEEWRTAMINLPVFPVNTPQAFYERMIAAIPDSKTGKSDPIKMQAFLASHPESVRATALIKEFSPSSGFDNTTFNSLNAFRFIDALGHSVPGRWSLVPAQPLAAAGPSEQPQQDKNYLFEALITQIHRQPLQWHLIITLGQAADPTNDATIPWPPGREQMDAGIVTFDQVESEETSPTRDLNFDPLVLPAGILPSDDPLLSARSAVYSQSFTRRAGETKEPSEITAADVKKGQ
jgi:catalase